MTIADLIARLEAAEGPSRELDWAITLAIATKVGGLAGAVELAWLGDPQRTQCVTAPTCARYTSSLDAALTLVPDIAYMLERWDQGTEALLIRYPDKHDPEDQGRIGGRAKTLPLALCIAALKARQATEPPA